MQLRRVVPLAVFVLSSASLLVLLAPEAAWAQSADPEAPDQIVFTGSVTVPRGQAVGEVVVFSGRVIVQGVVEGDVVVLEGPVSVSGQVNGSVIAADGVVRLGESARVGGDVVSSESIQAAAGAQVRGDASGNVRFSLEGPLAALGKLLGPVAIAVSVLCAGLVLLFLAPRAADAVSDALRDAPLASLAWGVLVTITVPVGAITLCILVLTLPLGLTLLLSLGLWWLLGLTWAAWIAGRSLVRRRRGRTLAFLAGWAVVAAVGLVPVLNVAIWILAPVIGIGAMLVAAWHARHPGGRGGRHRRTGPSPDEEAVEAGIA